MAPHLEPRIDVCVGWLREDGFDVVVGNASRGTDVTAAEDARAAELTEMLSDPEVRAVIPPWGGETAIDMVDVLDWEALAAAEPTWVVGFSVSTTWLVPLTLGWAGRLCTARS